MRVLLLLPLAIVATFAGGCRTASDDAEQTAFQVPKRDLTLQQSDAPPVEVASPVELARVPAEPRAATHQSKVRRAARSVHPAAAADRGATAEHATADVPVAAPASAATAMPVSQAAYEAPDPNALAPGQTVTVLPASGGSDPGWTDQGPPDARHGESGGTTIHAGGRGGDCGGRGGGRHPGGGAGPGLRGLR
jgi:hypothetical protein